MGKKEKLAGLTAENCLNGELFTLEGIGDNYSGNESNRQIGSQGDAEH
jgi:hypothetical protein